MDSLVTQDAVQVSCTVANCMGCEWRHVTAGRRRYYLGPALHRWRVPRFVFGMVKRWL